MGSKSLQAVSRKASVDEKYAATDARHAKTGHAVESLYCGPFRAKRRTSSVLLLYVFSTVERRVSDCTV